MGKYIGLLHSDDYRRIIYSELSAANSDLYTIGLYQYLIRTTINISYQEACRLAEELYQIEKNTVSINDWDYVEYFYSVMEDVYEVFLKYLTSVIEFITWGVNELDNTHIVTELLKKKDDKSLWKEIQDLVPQYKMTIKQRQFCNLNSSYENAPFNKIPGISLRSISRMNGSGNKSISIMYNRVFWDNWRGSGIDGISPWLRRRDERAKEIH